MRRTLNGSSLAAQLGAIPRPFTGSDLNPTPDLTLCFWLPQWLHVEGSCDNILRYENLTRGFGELVRRFGDLVMDVGQLSPPHEITLSAQSRRFAGIPPEATSVIWA